MRRENNHRLTLSLFPLTTGICHFCIEVKIRWQTNFAQSKDLLSITFRNGMLWIFWRLHFLPVCVRLLVAKPSRAKHNNSTYRVLTYVYPPNLTTAKPDAAFQRSSSLPPGIVRYQARRELSGAVLKRRTNHLSKAIQVAWCSRTIIWAAQRLTYKAMLLRTAWRELCDGRNIRTCGRKRRLQIYPLSINKVLGQRILIKPFGSPLADRITRGSNSEVRLHEIKWTLLFSVLARWHVPRVCWQPRRWRNVFSVICSGTVSIKVSRRFLKWPET